MKWYYIAFFVFFIIIASASAYKAFLPQTYNENGISFNYPGTWIKLTPNNLNSADDASLKSNVVAIGDPNSPETGNIIVLVQKTTKSGTIDEIVEASKADLHKDWGAVFESEKTITVDGRDACDVTYTTNSSSDKKERMVIFDKNGFVYCIIMGGPKSAFDGQKNNFDMIVNSFKVTK